MLVDPRNPNVVFVAALGHAYGPNAERGVFRSTDGGAHWSKVLYKDADTGAIDLAFEPGDPDTIYAALWQTRRPPWNVYPPSNGPGSGLYKSMTAAALDPAHRQRLCPAQPGRMGLAVAPSQPDRVYALADAAMAKAACTVPTTPARTGPRSPRDKRIWNRGWYFGGITVDPKNADRVYVIDTIVLRSDDGGKTSSRSRATPPATISTSCGSTRPTRTGRSWAWTRAPSSP